MTLSARARFAMLVGIFGWMPLTLQAAAGNKVSRTVGAPPMNAIVQADIYPQLDFLFDQLASKGKDISIDGVAALKSKDAFLPGKIAIGLSHALLNMSRDDPRFPDRLREFRAIADLTVEMDNDTWGIYYYLAALNKLNKAGLLEQAVRPATLDILRRKLDWRKFVTPTDYELINLPTNYFGVAFSVARLRMLLGWEDASAGKALLDKLMTHYAAYSGAYGFSDETPGDGRFDRYSILLVAEICARFIETDLAVTADLKAKLRKAAELALKLADGHGNGFSFGRSLGPYGETAMLEILSVAAYLDILSPDEKQYAYAYANQIVAKYVAFWYDPAMRSVDMWGKGRRTDAYRGKHRILGENFSLIHQIISTNAKWNQAGMQDQAAKGDLQAWLDRTQPAFSITWFAKGEYDRALAVYRDKGHVFSLNMVSGGASQHANSPYYPLPFSHGIVSGTADSGAAHAQLLPKFTLSDGSELIGTAFIKAIRTDQAAGAYRVRYRQDELDKIGAHAPLKDSRIQLTTEYTFQAGLLTRRDTYTAKSPVQVAALSLEFATFSDNPSVDGNRVSFGAGEVSSFKVSGLPECRARLTDGRDPFRAPYGPMKTHVTCSRGPFLLKEPLVVSWVIAYR